MTDNELLLAISDMLDKKLDEKLDERFTPIENRLGKLEEGFTSIDNRLNRLEERFTPVENRLGKLEEGFTSIDNRLDKLDSEVSALKTGQVEIRKELREVKHKVNDTYELALEAWGKSTENRTWLETLN